LDLFHIFRDGKLLKAFHPSSKEPPKLLLVFPYLKGKVRVWGTTKPPEIGFWG